MSISDARLVEGSLRGDVTALERLAKRYLRTAYAVALAVLRDPADAEDVAQDALVAALQRLAQLQDPARFRPWLSQIVRRRAYNFRRDDAGRNDLSLDFAAEVPSGSDSEHRQRTGELREHLLESMAGLKEVEREVLLLHDLDGMKHREIAELLELPEGTVRYHLFNARNAVRGELSRITGMPAHER